MYSTEIGMIGIATVIKRMSLKLFKSEPYQFGICTSMAMEKIYLNSTYELIVKVLSIQLISDNGYFQRKMTFP